MGETARRKLKYPKEEDTPDVPRDIEALALQLDNDTESGEGKLSERPAAKTRGRLYYVTEGPEKGLWWDNGAAWVQAGPMSAKVAIATEETITNVNYTKMTTPDQVEIFVPANGLIAVAFQAQFKSTSNGTLRAALFLGVNQLKSAGGAAPAVQEAKATYVGGANFMPLTSNDQGLSTIAAGPEAAYAGDVATGQIVGQFPEVPGGSGPCFIFAAAGSYTISVQYKHSVGNITARERKLWAWVVA